MMDKFEMSVQKMPHTVKSKKRLCIFCHNQFSMEQLKADKDLRLMESLLALWKMCVKHAKELSALHNEIEAAV